MVNSLNQSVAGNWGF